MRPSPSSFAGATVAACVSVGCAKAPATYDPWAVRGEAKVVIPTTVKVGPYRMDFVKEERNLKYQEFDPQPQFAHVSWMGHFRLTRPPGPTRQLRIEIQKPDLGLGQGGGRSYAYPSGPKPNWLDTIDDQNAVPVGWRGKRLDLDGEMQEVEAVAFEAVFRDVDLVAEPPRETLRADYSIRSSRAETVVLADGVTATLETQPIATSRLPITIRYDARKVLPHLATRIVEIEGLETNVGLTSGSMGASDGSGETRMDLWLDRGGRQEKDAKVLCVRFKLQKIARKYPFHLPVSLEWKPKRLVALASKT